MWKKTPKRHLKNKKVICSYYHFDFDKFGQKEKENFYNLDQYVDEYHVISEMTKEQLSRLTDKKITSIPFWVNQNVWFEIKDKEELRKSFDIDNEVVNDAIKKDIPIIITNASSGKNIFFIFSG